LNEPLLLSDLRGLLKESEVMLIFLRLRNEIEIGETDEGQRKCAEAIEVLRSPASKGSP
jgi:hypothetical protein